MSTARANRAKEAGAVVGTEGSLDGFYGSYQHSVTIQVPPFRGLEPKLGLHYDSSAGNGVVGVGWHLAGLGVIERTSAGKGAPRWTSTDIFLLNGVELVPCGGAVVSPSCSAGGTHASKIEGYKKIRRDPVTNYWHVTEKDGTELVFTPTHVTGAGPEDVFRWFLWRVVDTRGNIAQYNGVCDPNNECYWDNLAYGDAVVKLYYETRPDPITYATGRTLGRTNWRVKTIDVKVGGSRVRAYKLGYQLSAATQRSILTSVQMFGRDATLDGSGTVTGGTSLPAVTLGWDQDALSFPVARTWPTAGFFAIDRDQDDLQIGGADIADFNGDGLADVVWSMRECKNNWYPGTGCTDHNEIWLGTATGYVAGPAWPTAGFISHDKDTNNGKGKQDDGGVRLADVNGDGKTDILWGLWECRNTWFGNGCSAHQEIWLSTGTGFAPGPAWPTAGYFSMAGEDEKQHDGGLRLADFNGDGRLDLAWSLRECSGSFGAGCQDHTQIWLYGDSGYVAGPAWPTNGRVSIALSDNSDDQQDGGVRLADFDGDGKTDIAWALYECRAHWHGGTNGNCQQWKEIKLSTGTGFVSGPAWPVNGYFSMQKNNLSGEQQDGGVRLADMNGDGKTDVVWSLRECSGWFGSGCENHNEIKLYTGATWVNGPAWPSQGRISHSRTSSGDDQEDGGIRLEDVNGDGKIDVLWGLWECNGAWFDSGGCDAYREVWINTGTAFAAGPIWPTQAFFSLAENSSSQQDGGLRMADMDGDGKLDFVWALRECGGSYGAGCQDNTEILLQRSGRDVVTTVNNGMGGTTTIQYVPSTTWANTNNPPLVHTASAITQADGRGWSATTSYSYAGGLFDRMDRRFLGFHYAKATKPCLTGESPCPYHETWYAQDYASASKPERTDVRAGDGTLQSSIISEYTLAQTGNVYTSLETGRWEYVYAGGGSKRTYVSRTFDAHGNVNQETTWGDYDATGDEKTVRTLYRPNTTDYVVGLMAAMDTFAGVGTGGALLEQALFYYDGNTTWDAAPGDGKLTKTARWHDLTTSYVTVQAEYDSWGNTTAEIDEMGRRTEYDYDTTRHLYLVETRNPLLHESTMGWDPVCSVQTTANDPNGRQAVMTHDALCRVTETTYPLGGFERRSYVSFGTAGAQHIEVQTPGVDGTGDQWSRRYFDGLGRPWQTRARGPSTSDDVVVLTEYDQRGQVLRTSAPHYASGTPKWTTRAHDVLDRVTRVTHPDGSHRDWSFQLWTVTRTDELGRVEVDELDAHGRVLERRQTLGGATVAKSYEYDVRGNPTRIIDAAGNQWTFIVDSLGRRTRLTDPDAGTWTYEHDACGRVIAHVDAKGQRTETQFDALGRMTGRTLRAGTPQATSVSWTWDQPRSGYLNVGHLTGIEDGAGTATFDWDAAGRQGRATRAVLGTTYTFQRGYDAAGRLLWTTYPDGTTLGTPGSPLVYDRAGRLRAVPGVVTDVTYDARDLPLVVTNANGTTATYAYSADRGWLTDIDTTRPGVVIQDLAYARDAAGRILSVTSGAVTREGWTYGYDELDRLLSADNHADPAEDQTFTYDAGGNITYNSRVGAYTYPATGQPRPHAVTTAGGNSYSYDANGNLTAGAGRTITYDGANRPVSVNGDTYVYDADGNRLVTSAGGSTIVTLGDDYQIEGGVVTKHIALAGVLVAKRVGVDTFWLHTDHLGSIQAVTDATGVEVQRFEYRPYGERLASSTAHEEVRSYTGQRQDDSGLFYLHERYYDPALGRFLSPDPVAPAPGNMGLNRYAYALDNPVSYSDTTGMEADGGGGGSTGGLDIGAFASAVSMIGSLAGTLSSAPAMGAIGSMSTSFTSLSSYSSYQAGYYNQYQYQRPQPQALTLMGEDRYSAYWLATHEPVAPRSLYTYATRDAADMLLLAEVFMAQQSSLAAAAAVVAKGLTTSASPSGAYQVTARQYARLVLGPTGNPDVDRPVHERAGVYGRADADVVLVVHSTAAFRTPGNHVASLAYGAHTGALLEDGVHSLNGISTWNDSSFVRGDYEHGVVGTFYMSTPQYRDFFAAYRSWTNGHMYRLGDSNAAAHAGLVAGGYPSGTASLANPPGQWAGYYGWNNAPLEQRGPNVPGWLRRLARRAW